MEKKPKEKLIEGGCMYAFDRHSTDGRVKFWRCDHRAHGCQVRLHTDATTNEVFNVLNYLSIFKVISISHFLFRTIIKLRSLFFQIVKQVNMHNHEIDSRDVEIKKLKQILKRQALETDDDPRIVSNSVFLTSF